MFIIRVIILLIFPIMVSCAGRDSSPWKQYFFDGTNFTPKINNISKAIWLRNDYSPSTREQASGALSAVKLPPGTGAVAGICYINTSGGKLSGNTSFTPLPNEQITFKSKAGNSSAVKTDEDGYFIGHLTVGDYELFCRGVRTEFRITQGETTLVPIRGGKRMVD